MKHTDRKKRVCPRCGQRQRRYKRPFKKSERQHSKHMIRKELGGQ